MLMCSLPVEMTFFCHLERSREVSFSKQRQRFLRSTEHINAYVLASGRNDIFLSPRAKSRGLFCKQRQRFLRSTEHINAYVLASGRNDIFLSPRAKSRGLFFQTTSEISLHHLRVVHRNDNNLCHPFPC